MTSRVLTHAVRNQHGPSADRTRRRGLRLVAAVMISGLASTACSSAASLGIEEFILSGYPQEAYWFGEGVLPVLRARGLVGGPADAAASPQPLRVSA